MSCERLFFIAGTNVIVICMQCSLITPVICWTTSCSWECWSGMTPIIFGATTIWLNHIIAWNGSFKRVKQGFSLWARIKSAYKKGHELSWKRGKVKRAYYSGKKGHIKKHKNSGGAASKIASTFYKLAKHSFLGKIFIRSIFFPKICCF